MTLATAARAAFRIPEPGARPPASTGLRSASTGALDREGGQRPLCKADRPDIAGAARSRGGRGASPRKILRTAAKVAEGHRAALTVLISRAQPAAGGSGGSSPREDTAGHREGGRRP